MAMITIGTTDLPTPSKYDIGLSDIVGENTRRNTQGYLIADKIADKVKISLGWRHLTNSQMVALQATFSSFFFTATYHDPRTGGKVTKTFYRSDMDTGTFKYDSISDIITSWSDVSFSLIQR